MTIIASGIKGADFGFGVNGQNHRNQSAAFVSPIGDLAVAGGVQSGCKVTRTTGMSGAVSRGRLAIPAVGSFGENGVYIVAITDPETFTLPASDATRNRVDRLIVQVTDPSVTGASADPAVSILVLQGTYPSSGSPTAPAIPAGAVSLGAIPVPAGATTWNDLSEKAPTLYGLPAPWRAGQPFAMQVGNVALSSVGNNANVSTTVNFDVTRFSAEPLAFVSTGSGVYAFAGKADLATGKLTVGAVNRSGSTATNVRINWQLIQMTPTTAAG